MADDDDDWGDFVKSPQQQQQHQSSSNSSFSSTIWVKPNGALPLSIFGDAADDDEYDVDLGGVENSSNQNNNLTTDLYINNTHPHDEEINSVQNQKSAVIDFRNTDSVGNDEFSFKQSDENDSSSLFDGWLHNFTGFVASTPPSAHKFTSHDFVSNGQGQTQQLDGDGDGDDDDDDDDGWEFKDAFSDQVHNYKVGLMACEVSERSAYSSGTESGSNRPLDLFETSNGSINFFGASAESVDYVGTSSGVSSTFQEVEFIGIQPSTEANGFTLETSSIVDQNNVKGLLNQHSADVGSAEFDENFGEFRGASAGTGPKPGELSANGVLSLDDAVLTPGDKIQVDIMAHEVSEGGAYQSRTGSSSNGSLELFETSNRSFNIFASSSPSDYFATSSGIPSTSQEVDFIGVQPHIEQNNIKVMLNHSTDVGGAELDEDFGEFTAASAETGPKPGGTDTKVNYLRGAIPLSIFGNEEPESAGSSDVHDLFINQSTDERNSLTPTTVISVNDLISSLYSQAEQTSPTNTVQEPAKTQLSLSDEISSSITVNHDDHLDDGSWSFQDASQKRADIEASLSCNEDTSSKLKLNNYVDFYSRLKEELGFVAKCQFKRLKQARGNAALSGEDATAALDCDFQFFWKELEEMNVLYEESNQRDHHSGDSYLNELVQVLLEPQFQLLESEYHLSQKLLLVEKDLRSAMELMRHTTTMLKILTLGTMEEQKAYISLWSEMISACLQELKHGALIWKQAVGKNIESQLLFEPQGRQFFLALGEIYRVVVVLGASAKLFKPWALSGSVDSPDIYILLEECHSVWSTSGLEEVISTVSAPSALNNTSLLESINHILGLDAITLQNVFIETESRCRLSILTERVAPGMKMIMWGNEQCFVALANVWANLISRNPPKLPLLNVLAD